MREGPGSLLLRPLEQPWFLPAWDPLPRICLGNPSFDFVAPNSSFTLNLA